VNSNANARDQTGGENDWRDTVRDLVPLKINRFVIRNGSIHFRDFGSDPPVLRIERGHDADDDEANGEGYGCEHDGGRQRREYCAEIDCGCDKNENIGGQEEQGRQQPQGSVPLVA